MPSCCSVWLGLFCAITGTGFPIDRFRTSALLGFDGPTGNTYGSIATVDYLIEGVVGSITHCTGLAAAAVAKSGQQGAPPADGEQSLGGGEASLSDHPHDLDQSDAPPPSEPASEHLDDHDKPQKVA